MDICPSRELLRRWINYTLEPQEYLRISEHVRHCLSCQKTLKEFSGSTTEYHLNETKRDPKASQQDGSSSDSSSLPIFRDYEILSELGRGGMGVVYKARQKKLDRAVALKLIRLNLQFDAGNRDESIHRFRQEADIIAHLQHPGIVRIYDIIDTEDYLAIVLEYCRDGSLEETTRQAPIDPQRATRIVEEVAQALQLVHDQGIIHRDLKPGNILIGDDGRLKISDFGLARRSDGTRYTQSGAMMGSPGYMAPEQVRGDCKEIGPACDLWALGVLLYELLTGKTPFQSPKIHDIFLRTLYEDPVPLRRLQPSVPRDLETICLKCLDKIPQRRYPSAKELADDLQRVLNGQTIHARPVGLLEKSWRWARRNPGLAISSLGFVLTLLLGTILSSSLALWAWEEQRQAKNNELLAVENATLAIENASRAKTNEALAKQHEQAAINALELNEQTLIQTFTALERVFRRIDFNRSENPKTRLLMRELAYDFADASLELLKLNPKNIETKRKLANYFSVLANGFANSDTLALAIHFSESALKLYRELNDSQQVANLSLDLVTRYRPVGNFVRAQSILNDLVSQYQKLYEGQSNDRQVGLTLSRSLKELGNLKMEMGIDQHGSEVEKLFIESMHILQSIRKNHPDDLELASEEATTRFDWVIYLSKSNKHKEALEAHIPLERLHRELVSKNYPGQKYQLAKQMLNRGILLSLMDQMPDAIRDLQESSSILRQLNNDDPFHRRYQYERSRCLGHLASCLQISGEYAQALPLAEEANRIAYDYWRSDLENQDLAEEAAVRVASLAWIHEDLCRQFAVASKKIPLIESVALLLESHRCFNRSLDEYDNALKGFAHMGMIAPHKLQEYHQRIQGIARQRAKLLRDAKMALEPVKSVQLKNQSGQQHASLQHRLLVVQAISCEISGFPEEALMSLEQLRPFKEVAPSALYPAAVMYSRLAEKLPRQREQCVQRALEALRHWKEGDEVLYADVWWRAKILKQDRSRYLVHYLGYPDTDDEWITPDRLRTVEYRQVLSRLRYAQELEPLRTRSEFQKLIQEVEAQQGRK